MPTTASGPAHRSYQYPVPSCCSRRRGSPRVTLSASVYQLNGLSSSAGFVAGYSQPREVGALLSYNFRLGVHPGAADPRRARRHGALRQQADADGRMNAPASRPSASQYRGGGARRHAGADRLDGTASGARLRTSGLNGGLTSNCGRLDAEAAHQVCGGEGRRLPDKDPAIYPCYHPIPQICE